MNKLTKLSVVFAALAVIALLIAAGGLLAMFGLHLPKTAMLPQPITFALLMVPVLFAFSGIAVGFASKHQRDN